MPRLSRRRRRPLARAASLTGAIAVALGLGIAPAFAAEDAPAATAADLASPPAAGNTPATTAPNPDGVPTAATALSRAAGAPVRLTLPATTGRYRVGTVNLHLRDTARTDPYLSGHQPRELMVSLWYPATDTARYGVAPWMQSLTAAHYLASLRVPPGSITVAATAGHTGAPVDGTAGKLPVLLYSTGLHSDRAQGTALVQDLASRGYLVVAIDHTHDANEVQFPANRLEVNRMPAGSHSSDTVAVRAADTKFVINQLAAIARGSNPDVEHARLPTGLAGSVDTSRIGMFGWSLGGAAVATAMQADSRIDVGANLDGTFFGSATSKTLKRPFLLFSSENHNRNNDSSWSTFWSHLHGVRLDLKLLGARHVSFSDNEVTLPQAAGVMGLSADRLKQTLGTIAPNRAIAVQRTYLAAFFDKELRHQKRSLLDGPSSNYPEIRFVR